MHLVLACLMRVIHLRLSLACYVSRSTLPPPRLHPACQPLHHPTILQLFNLTLSPHHCTSSLRYTLATLSPCHSITHCLPCRCYPATHFFSTVPGIHSSCHSFSLFCHPTTRPCHPVTLHHFSSLSYCHPTTLCHRVHLAPCSLIYLSFSRPGNCSSISAGYFVAASTGRTHPARSPSSIAYFTAVTPRGR